MMRRIAVLNSGGDSPGMNAAVSSVARSAALYSMRLVGIIRGYMGTIRQDEALLDAFFENARRVIGGDRDTLTCLDQVEHAVRNDSDGNMPDIRPMLLKYREQLSLAPTMEAFLERFPDYRQDMVDLNLETILDINNLPGSFLRTARCNEFRRPVVRLRAVINLVAAGIEGLVVIGGDGSFQGATRLCQMGMPCIGIPGTIDNDLAYTEMTLGYDTAVNVCMNATLQVRSMSRSHDRPHVVEVMGRECGDIALRTAMATGSEIVIVREVPWRVDDIAHRLQAQIDKGNTRATIVISEGAYEAMEPFNVYEFLGPIYDDQNRHREPSRYKQLWYQQPMNAERLAEVLKYKCHDASGNAVESRATVLGYTQRGEKPSAYDAAFAFEAGNMAVQLLVTDRQDLVIGVKDGRVYSLSIEEAFSMQRDRDSRFNHTMYNLINQL